MAFAIKTEADWILLENGKDNLQEEDAVTNLAVENSTPLDLTAYLLYGSVTLKVNTIDFTLSDAPALAVHLGEAVSVSDPSWAGNIVALETSDTSQASNAHELIKVTASNTTPLPSDTAPFDLSETAADATFHYLLEDATATLWHSLGTEAGTDNSIAYWTTIQGVPTYATHLMTLPAGAAVAGAHQDLWDWSGQHRFQWVTNSIPLFYVRGNGTINVDSVRVQANGTYLLLQKYIASAFSSVSSQTAVLNTGNFYWFVVTISGTTFTVVLTNDNAGAPGTTVATVTGTIADASVQTGRILWFNAGTASFAVGGAFPNVCTVTGPVPTNAGVAWITNILSGEPAFCWSKNNPDSGAFSLSIYNANGAGQGQWIGGSIGVGTYTHIGRVNGTIGRAPSMYFYDGTIRGAVSVTTNGSWQTLGPSGAYTSTSPGQLYLDSGSSGVGTLYFDNVSVVSSGVSVFTDNFEPVSLALEDGTDFAPGTYLTEGALAYKYRNLVVRTQVNTVGPQTTLGRATVYQPGLRPGNTFKLTSTNQGYAAQPFQINQVIVTWGGAAMPAPFYDVQFGDTPQTLAAWTQVTAPSVPVPVAPPIIIPSGPVIYGNTTAGHQLWTQGGGIVTIASAPFSVSAPLGHTLTVQILGQIDCRAYAWDNYIAAPRRAVRAILSGAIYTGAWQETPGGTPTTSGARAVYDLSSGLGIALPSGTYTVSIQIDTQEYNQMEVFSAWAQVAVTTV